MSNLHTIQQKIVRLQTGGKPRVLDLFSGCGGLSLGLCQAFARVGRSKLREVADHPEAFRHDLRARLYIEYLDYVEDCSPLAVLMENVPDMLNHGGHNIAEEVCEVLESRGYVCGYTLLNAAHYGVPQMRERMFLVAYRRELNQQVQFPAPTNWIELPPGYQGSRAVALKLLPRRFDSVGHYTPPPAPNSSMPPAVSAEEAIGDLPHIDARKLLAAGLLSRGARRFDVPVPFLRPVKISEYAQTMRAWPRYKAGAALYDHVIRYLPRDYSLFARLSPGDQYPEAHAMAEKLFEQKLARLEKQGKAPRKGSRAWTELRSEIVPPYDPTKFPNKWFGR